MSAKAVSKIFYNPKEPGSVGEVSGSWDASGSFISQMPHDKRSNNTYGVSKPIRCTSQRAVVSPGTAPIWRGSIFSSRPT